MHSPRRCTKISGQSITSSVLRGSSSQAQGNQLDMILRLMTRRTEESTGLEQLAHHRLGYNTMCDCQLLGMLCSIHCRGQVYAMR